MRSRQVMQEALRHILDVGDAFPQVLVLDGGKDRCVLLRHAAHHRLRVLASPLDALKDLLRKGSIVQHHHMNVQDVGMARADCAPQAILDLADLAPGLDHRVLEPGDFRRHLRFGDVALGYGELLPAHEEHRPDHHAR